VRAFVLRSVRDKRNLVRLPQALQQDMIQIRKARYRYAVENQGHAPSETQLADLLQWRAARVDAALRGLSSVACESLDTTATGASDHQTPLGDRVADVQHTDGATETELYHQQLHATLRKALRERDPQRAQITRLKYGLEDGKEWTYPQLARRFNMTANGAKGIVRTEVAFLRRRKQQVLKQFVL